MASNPPFDVCVRGAGVVGRALALKLGQAKLRVALVDEGKKRGAHALRDVRAYALNHASRHFLQQLRCWPEGAASTPVSRMEVFGDAGGAVQFEAPAPPFFQKRGGNAFGDVKSPALSSAVAKASTAEQTAPVAWIVDTAALEDVLVSALRFQATVELVDAPVDASLTAICEGGQSATRERLGVALDSRPYPQHALATRLCAAQAHGGVARQWFNGPHIVALLPLGGETGSEYAMVWSTSAEHADSLLALDESGFVAKRRTRWH